MNQFKEGDIVYYDDVRLKILAGARSVPPTTRALTITTSVVRVVHVGSEG